ncbi:MAG TPA: hypothetical protein VF029_01830 [Actinomycetota bacterium]
MTVLERVRGLKDEARLRTLDARMSRADRDRDRLRLENEALRERLQAAAEERSRWLDTIEGLSRTRGAKPRGRLGRIVVLVGAAGSAYVLGAKAGRERYEQIRTWWRDLRSRAVQEGEGMAEPTAGSGASRTPTGVSANTAAR